MLADTEVTMTWSGRRKELVKMMEIEGDLVFETTMPIKCCFQVHEVAALIMCIGHVQFVEYCLMDVREDELVLLALVPQDHFDKGKKEKKQKSQMAVAALDSHTSLEGVRAAVVQSLTLTKKEAVDNISGNQGIISGDDPQEMKSTSIE